MSFRKALLAGLGAVVLAATVSLSAVTPAAAAAENCYAWRTLKFGDSGRHATVEPGAPWHVRLTTERNGYELMEFCFLSGETGKAQITIRTNATKLSLTSTADRRVTADGNSAGRDNWFVCALDAKWALVSFYYSTRYLGRNSSWYLTTTSDTPNGDTLWRLSEFRDIPVSSC